MTLGCPECGSLLSGRHERGCSVGRREQREAAQWKWYAAEAAFGLAAWACWVTLGVVFAMELWSSSIALALAAGYAAWMTSLTPLWQTVRVLAAWGAKERLREWDEEQRRERDSGA